MTRSVRDAVLRRDSGIFVLVGTFDPIPLEERQPYVRFAENPKPTFYQAGPPAVEDLLVRVHALPVVTMPNWPHIALLVRPGDMVTLLRGWTWRDPHLAARWRA